MEIHVKNHKRPVVIDLFCGAGGESSGLYKAFQERGMEVEMHAVNHWELAIETHSMNHPEAAHYTEDVFKGSPKKHVRNGHVSLLWASPECTYHSRARGKAGELNPQSRAGANVVLDWCQDLTVGLIEQCAFEAGFVDFSLGLNTPEDHGYNDIMQIVEASDGKILFLNWYLVPCLK